MIILAVLFWVVTSIIESRIYAQSRPWAASPCLVLLINSLPLLCANFSCFLDSPLCIAPQNTCLGWHFVVGVAQEGEWILATNSEEGTQKSLIWWNWWTIIRCLISLMSEPGLRKIIRQILCLFFCYWHPFFS